MIIFIAIIAFIVGYVVGVSRAITYIFKNKSLNINAENQKLRKENQLLWEKLSSNSADSL